MNLQEARKRLPELEGLSDSDAIDVIQQVYYPEIERAKIEKALGYKPPPPPKPERSAVRAAGDLGLQFAGGAVSGVRMMTDLVGADNVASRGLRSAEDALQALQSAAAKADQQEIAAILKEAEGKGILNEVVAAAKAFGTAPAAMVAQAIGSSLPTLATALIPGVGVGATVARMGAAGAVGAGQGAGAIKGAIYDEVKTAPLPGETPEQTEARAVAAQSYGGQNADQIALGGALGAFAGSTGIERAAGALRNGIASNLPAGMLARTSGKTVIKELAPSMLSRVGMGALTEAAPEALQGGQEKFATNTALAREGFDVDPWSGVVAGGTMEALAGAATGGLFGVPNPAVQERRDPAKAAGDSVRSAKVPESGPMTRAVNAGTEMAARQAEANVAAQVAAIEPPAPAAPAATTTLTGTDPASLVQPPENPLLAAAQEVQADRQGQARADAALARMERRGARDLGAQRDFSRPAGAEPIEPTIAPAEPDPADLPFPAAGDILNPKDEPFKTRMAAERVAKKTPGDVIAVFGGFVVRPRQESASAAQATTAQAAAPDALPLPSADATAAPEPAAGAATAAQPRGPAGQRLDELSLPRELAGAKPRYSYGPKQFGLEFDSDVDRAAYVIAQEKTSSRDADYLKFVMEATGLDEAGARAYGARVRDAIKAQAKDAEPGSLKVPRVPREPGSAGESSAAAQPQSQAGEWQTFPPETGSLNLPRAEMPQVKAEHRGAMVNFLNARGVEHEADEVDPADLKPTQAEYSLDKVKRAQEFGGTDRAILVSADGYVVDGHHQWLAKGNKGEPVKVIRLKAPIKDLLPMVREFPSSTVDESTANVQDQAQTTEGAAPAQAPRTETPATAGGDGAAAGRVPDQGRTADAQTPGVAPAPSTREAGNTARDKALQRIERGTAYFGTADKAQAFIDKFGLGDTHEAVQAKPGRFEVRARAAQAPAVSPTPAPAAAAPAAAAALAPSVSPLTQARNDLMEVNTRIEQQGQVVDDRLLERQRKLKAVIKELEGDQAAAAAPKPTKPAPASAREVTSETARRGEFTLKSGERARVVEQPRRGVFSVQVGKADGSAMESMGVFQMDDQFSVSRVEARAQWAVDNVRDAAIQFAQAQRKDDAPAADQNPVKKPAVSANTIFTEDAAAAARALLKRKLGQLNTGIDPEILQAGITLAGYHIEKGARTFAAYARAMLADLGDGVKPYLKSWYAAVSLDPRAAGFATDLTPLGDVMAADVDSLADEADTQETQGDDDATRPLDRPGPGALEGTPAPDVQGTAGPGPAGDAPARSGRGDQRADAEPDGSGVPAPRGVGSDARAVPVPVRGTRGERGSAGERGPAAAARDERQPSLLGDDGRADRSAEGGRVSAPGAVEPPGFKPTDFTIEEDFELGEGGQKTKYRNNAAAIRLLKVLDTEQRHATPDEQAVLAKYVGWGGISQAFDPDNADWSREFKELRELLSDEEYDAARRSTRYAHYTSRPIIQGMYDAMKRLGFTGGKILEPGAGVGNFMGLMPADLRSGSRMTGVERERIAAGIAKHLYPNQNMQLQDFTQFQALDGYFDAVIGNPPFAADGLTDQSGRKHLSGLSVHDYFFAKSIDLLREGGVFAAVVSNGFMDKAGDRARRYIGERAKLLGAIRLPNNAFAKNANTEVTTDIIFLQKLPEAEWGSKAAKADLKRWLDTTTIPDPAGGAPVKVNQYFADNPSMMLGEYGRFGTMYGPDQPALVARAGQDTAALLRQAIERLPEGAYEDATVAATAKASNDIIEALRDKSVQEGGFYVDGGKLYQRMPDRAGETSARLLTPETQWTEKTTLGESRYDRLVRLADMRRTLRSLLAAELADDVGMEALRRTLNAQYDEFVSKHGLINDASTAQVFDDDPDFPLLAALELNYVRGMGPAAAKAAGIKPFKSKADKAPIFARRVIEKRQAVTKAETPEDALNVSIAERGRIDAGYIGRLLGRPPEEVLDELTKGEKPALFIDPVTGEHVLRDAYLSGNVRKKLEQAKLGGLDRNVRALMEVQPEDVGAHEISARIGAPWVPTDVYADFIKALLGDGTAATVVYLPTNSSFMASVTPGSDIANRVTFGTPRVDATEILSALLNNRTIKVMDEMPDGKRVLNKEATDAANEKAADIKAKFGDWIFADPDRSEVLVRAYNDTNNNYVTRVYDGSRMEFPGKVPDAIIKFRRHQRNAIARIVQDRTALLDHVVGAGKTFTIVAGAMELRRTGLARKPMVAVPNHLVKQWAADFYRLYPGANVLTATKKDFERQNRRRFLAKIATGDWDAVVIAHSSFGFIKPDAEFEANFNEQQIAHIRKAIEDVDAGDTDKKAKKRTVKQLEAMLERLENRIAALRDKPVDDLLDFKQIGVDQLFVDEAHLFKNLMFSTKMQNVQGLGDAKGSQRAYDMYVKTAQVYAQNGREQGVVFATGTPVSNTLAEMYHMMRYLMPTAMREQGFESFDAWANTFASVDQVWMQKPSGDGYKASDRLASFNNAPELLKMFDQVADTVTMDDIKKAYAEENNGREFPLPKLKGDRRTPVSLVKSEAQDAYMQEIADRALALEKRKGPPQKGEDNFLTIMGDARKAAMDIRLVDLDRTEREPGARIDRASDEVVARYRKFDAVKGTQLVFSDLGTPLSGAKKEMKEYEELRERIAVGDDPEVQAEAALGDEAALKKLEDAEAAQEELDAKGRDWLDAIKAALRGFSVYDDFKKALVEKGIPEHEIAFIHDYNTDEQKAALYRKVNAGVIRVLMGSTPKLGAGTNVQERLVALHHLDVPWKPSDVEQREGRIIRQGNRLADTIPGFEVEILAYVTQDTLDMRMWQTQEVKLKMINQLRSRQIAREIENPFEQAEMSAGEMQAAATGNMDLLREIQLRADVKRLEQRKRSFDAQRNDLVSRRKRAERNVGSLPQQIEELKALAEPAMAYFRSLEDRPFSATINGETFDNRPDAESKLRELVKGHDQALADRKAAADEAGEKAGERFPEGSPERSGAVMDAREAYLKANPTPKMAVEFNGKTYGSKASLGEAMIDHAGDREPIAWEVGGETYVRRAQIASAIEEAVVDAGVTDTLRDVGTIGGFNVTVEGNRDRHGHRLLDIVLERDGRTVDTQVMPGDKADGRAQADSVIRAVERVLSNLPDRLQYAEYDLRKAKKELADLDKTSMPDVWPDQAKLDKARADHKEVLQRLAGKKDDGSAPTPDAADVRFSRGSGQGITKKAAADVVDAIRSRWANAPEVVVVATMRDPAVPRAVREADIQQRSLGATGEPEGFWYGGKAYIVASALNGPADVVRVLFHETLGHYGLRGQFGEALTPILKQLAALRRPLVAAKAKAYGLDMDNEQQRLQAAEEVLAEMAQTRPDLGYVVRAIAAIKAWLRKHVPLFKDMALSDAEIIQQFILPARRFVERGAATKESGQRPAAAFSIDAGSTASDTRADGQADTGPEAEFNLRVLGRDIAAHLGISQREFDAVRPYDARVLQGDAALRAVAESFGSEVQGFGLRADLLEADRDRFGFFAGVRTGGIVFLRDSGNGRPHLAVLGHELAHELATKRRDLFDKLVTEIRPYVDQGKYPEFLKSAVAKNSKSSDKAREEFIGEVLSDGFMDRDFWRALGNKNPSLLRQIGHLVMDMVESVLRTVGYTKQTERYLTDYRAVMKIAGEVMGEFGISKSDARGLAWSRRAGSLDDDALQAFSEDVVARHNLAAFDLSLLPGGDIALDMIQQYPDRQGKGIGSAAMRELAAFADRHGARVVLTPEEDAAPSGARRARLVEFYGRFGFVERKVGGYEMVREPSEGPMFSRSSPAGIQKTIIEAVPQGITQRLEDLTASQRGFNRWWHRTVGTQLHKAKTNKDFGRVFYAVQDFMKDTSRMATLAADRAPDLLPQVDSLRDVQKLLPQMVNTKARKADLKAASDALFDGTLRYTRNEDGEAVPVDADSAEAGGLVWTTAELRERGLNDKAIALYRQARASINQSLDSLMAADVYRMSTGMRPEMLASDPAAHASLMERMRRAAASDDPRAAVSLALRALNAQGAQTLAQIGRLRNEVKGREKEESPSAFLARSALKRASDLMNQINQARETMQAKIDRIAELQAKGYAPLMRFGPYTVDVVDESGARVFFGMYETQFAANRAARRFREQGLTVGQGVKSQREFELLKGVSPETAMLFADMLGIEKNDVMQAWLQNALAEQSALKRHIRRKGIAGFDEDSSRVVAAFITSNARAGARALHGLRIQERVEAVREGDVKDEAIALAQYVDNPREEAQAVRSLLFINYIGGSIASALVNLTQTVVQTFPYLAQFGGVASSARHVAAAMKMAVGKIDDAELAAAVKRAEDDGVIKPQEVFQLQAEASRSLGSDLRVRAALALWGSFFQAAEVFNRRVAFIAAYQTGKAQKVANPFAFAENAVDETQGVFNKGNRPNWSRGAVGATLFTFKTFTIQYVEFLKRLPPKEKALALAVLVVLSGMRGIPFAEDAEDIIDTVAQHLGYSFTTREAMHRFAANTLGREFADFLLTGATGTGLIPFDVSQRLGMGDLLPATGMLKPSETRREDQVLEVFGVAGGFVRDALKGEVRPVAIRNLAKGWEMYDRGIYTDTRGRKVMDVDAADAAFKAIGLQPAGVAAESRAVSAQYEQRALFTKVKGQISEQIALGMFENDPDKVRRARERLAEWNEKNPDQKIVLSSQGIRRRVVEMRKDRTERFVSTSPRELRAQTREALAE